MLNLGPGLVLITLALSCAACGGSPAVLTAFRTEEQAQTHCPKDIVVWLDPQSGVYYFRAKGHMVARMQAAMLVVPKPTPQACTGCQTDKIRLLLLVSTAG
jgi:hypothetical protein